MKKIILALISICFVLASCKKANQSTTFDINYSNNITVPDSSMLNTPFNLYTPSVESNSDTKFQINGTREDKIESITLKELTLNLNSPSDSTLSFLKSIEIYIQASDISEERIAWKEEIPETTDKAISLEVSSTNLKPFINSENFKLRLRTTNDEVITSDYILTVDYTFSVAATLL